MPLSPDEIAQRSFSPSADGYHQGEVRAFLERTAADYAAIDKSLPESQREINELMLSLATHDQRLQFLERRLQAVLDQLDESNQRLGQTQEQAEMQLAEARELIEHQRSLIATLTMSQTSPTPAPLAIDDQVVDEPTMPPTPQVDDQPDDVVAARHGSPLPPPPLPPAPSPTTAPPSAGAGNEPLPPNADVETAEDLRPSIAPPARPAVVAPESPSPTSAGSPLAPPAAWAQVPPPIDAPPSMQTQSTPDPHGPPAEAATLFDSLEQGPLIADNANDLLDTVLDDVMGTITERPDA